MQISAILWFIGMYNVEKACFSSIYNGITNTDTPVNYSKCPDFTVFCSLKCGTKYHFTGSYWYVYIYTVIYASTNTDIPVNTGKKHYNDYFGINTNTVIPDYTGINHYNGLFRYKGLHW